MDKFGTIFLVIIIVIIVVSNILFYKKLQKIHKKHFKHMLLFFLFCVVSIMIIGTLYFAFQNSVLIDLLKIKNTYAYRITKSIIVIVLSNITNYYFSKFYLKRISKTKNEIELIGIE